MIKKNKIQKIFLDAKAYLCVGLFLLVSCSKTEQNKSLGDKKIEVFKDQIVHFSSDQKENTDDFKIFTDGRLVLKKVKLPKYQKDVKISAELVLQSNGDRWDKSGSCFIIPSGQKKNFLDYLEKRTSLPTDSIRYEKLKGVFPTNTYHPSFELMRFMTPFGVGFYSESNKKSRKPVYIDSWEKNVVWKQNVTQFASELVGEVWIGVWIDTWTKEGYKLSLTLDFDETEAKVFPLKKTTVLPVTNTVYYTGEKGYPDIFARKDFKITVNVPENAKNASLYYIVTGHGGHSEGDEFTQKENIIYHNDNKVYHFTPWRTDCASFRRFNPTSGVWLQKDTASYLDFKARKYKLKVIEERIASSDYSRSNWCPGSDVVPVKIELGDLKKGDHTFTFSIPEAQAIEKDKLNHWLISSYLYYEK